jgi:adenosylcobalamin-dependent ribonucleoside-triphosphate reductase
VSHVTAVPFGPSGEVVFNRTYSRTKEDGGKETWPETVVRVVDGNLALVYGSDRDKWSPEVVHERQRLQHYMHRFALIPAGRHLWATGVPGRQYLFNCHVAGWGEKLSDHFSFSFLRLMEGGGVGANYSMKHISKFGAPTRHVQPHVICKPEHPDMAELHPFLSDRFIPESSPDYDVHDSREGWAQALVSLIDEFYTPDLFQCQEVLYDVSGVRPSGSPLKTFGGTASGPAPLARMLLEVATVLNRAYEAQKLTPLDVMEIDHAIAECVVSGGNRRSARMSIVHWADPYIREFLACKQIPGLHWTTNISVEIDDEFLNALNEKSGGFFKQSHAQQVHKAVVKGMLTNGEPGYWNSSLSQVGEVGEVVATNPCGEIALEEWENCNLGHVNMDWFAGRGLNELEEAHVLMTRFLIRATYGDVNDPGQKDKLLLNRRIGVGHLGVQGYWAKNGVKYSDIPVHAQPQLEHLYSVVRHAAREYAFKLRIPEPVKVTAMAPTGSVAKLCGATESAQPIHSRYFEQRIRFSKRDEAQFATVMEAMSKGFVVEDDVYDASGMTAVVVYPTENLLLSQVRQLGLPEDVVQSQDELTVGDMLAVQEVYQKYYADNAVSYTVNIQEGTVTLEELAAALVKYLPNLKGTTVMVDASRPQSPYTRITKEAYETAVATTIDDSTDESCSTGACPVR